MEIEKKLLHIFEAYNLCDAESLGRLVRQEMLVALGQPYINWELVSEKPEELTYLKNRYEEVHRLKSPKFKEAFKRE